jgi:hypothetical protein
MDSPASPLLTAMTQMHTALLSGDFAAMAGLTQILEAQMSLGPRDMAGFAAQGPALRRMAAENEALLRSTQRGLRAAQRRIAEIRGVSSGLSTYTADGTRNYRALRDGPDHRA